MDDGARAGGRGGNTPGMLPRPLGWRVVILLPLVLLLGGGVPVPAQAGPAVLLLDPAALSAAQAAAAAGDPALQPALQLLRARADQALGDGPFTVTAKTQPPPSGDVHDYTSLSIYWWPDPQGGPYVQRDGVRNPEADDATRYDAAAASKLTGDVESLALAYFLTGHTEYAHHAVDLLHGWFVDPATCMHPNLTYAQLIPGRQQVRGIGIIEGRRFTRIVDSISLLDGCSCFSAADRQALRQWFGALADWLRSSRNGQLEAAAANNHGVWYDVQVADFALFGGDTETARQVVAAARERRIADQIAPDGSLPRELARTRSLHYSNFDLQAFAELATLGQQVDVDLWGYQAPTGASLRAALDFLVPYLSGAQTWPYDEITQVDAFAEAGQTLNRASQAYPDAGYQDLLAQLAADQSPLDQLRLHLGLWPD